MIFQPAILALLLASFAATAMVLVASGFGIQVLRHWDMDSGSGRQIALERRTYLVSILLGFAFTVELASLLLFVFNADRMAPQFVGAMCAVGTLNADPWGFPTIGLKILNFFLAGIWLVMNHVDNKGWDYPLIRAKYHLLLIIAPLLAAEALAQAAYFLGLDADVITSCCGSLFGSGSETVAAEMSNLPLVPSMVAFYGVMGATLLAGVYFIRRGRGGLLFAGMSAIAFVVAIAAIISFISVYIYEHPHHHCPFDVLQGGYHYVGYALYLPLFTATAFGLGLGAVLPFSRAPSLLAVLPAAARRYAIVSVSLFGLFLVVAVWSVARSQLILLG